MTCTCCHLSPFRWKENKAPSIFMTPAFTYGASTGKTMNQIASEGVQAFEERTGRSLGTVGGISDKADRETAQRNDQRTLAKKRKG